MSNQDDVRSPLPSAGANRGVGAQGSTEHFRGSPLQGYDAPASESELADSARAFYQLAKRRRTVRDFSPAPIPQEVISRCIAAAGSSPSGANQQPWHFAAVSNPAIKNEIRVAAEKEEKDFYEGRAPQQWLDTLRALGTNDQKPFLEIAPWLIAVFARSHGVDAAGEPIKHYYVSESVGIAVGVLISALNHCGIATLTHTPSPMRFLNPILGRPSNERPFLLLVAGFPAEGCQVPDISRRPLEEIATFH